MSKLLERFLRYVTYDTTAVEDAGLIPSSAGQWELAKLLQKELLQLGLSDAVVDENCFVLAGLPATEGYEDAPVLGFLAHLDTAPDCIGKRVHPLLHRGYQGDRVVINEASGMVIDPAECPDLLRYIGDDIITSDGTTLLGADDKGGIAIIMQMVEELMKNTDIKHGPIRIAFTPDEEIAVGGASIFDIPKFGAEIGFTVDGDGIGEFNYENFNASKVDVRIKGDNVHTGEAKGKMVNANGLAMEYDSLVPKCERAEHTEGREGFYHLAEMSGRVDETHLKYLLRDFEKEGMSRKKEIMQDIASLLNKKYGDSRISLVIEDEYANMKDFMSDRNGIVDLCLKAYESAGVEPKVVPIRGGTDGATLSEKGLFCPNIFIGGHLYHSIKEFVSLQAMEKAKDILINIIRLAGEKRG